MGIIRTPQPPRLKPAPPILTPPNTPPGSATRGKALAVIVAVDNAQTPRYATVAVNDHFPFEAGYALPLGSGPFAEGVGPGQNTKINTVSDTAVTQIGIPLTIEVDNISGITTSSLLTYDLGGNAELIVPSAVPGPGGSANSLQATFTKTHIQHVSIVNTGAPVGFFYFYNNAAGIGGSIVWVDLDSRQVISFTGDTSTVAPSPYYSTITGHRHNGNYDPAGYQNPAPVNLSYPETTGNLPYNQNTLILQGVVNSDGNVIAVDFAPGMLQLINSGQYKGMYQMLVDPICDDVGFDIVATQWLWVSWKLKYDVISATSSTAVSAVNTPITVTLTNTTGIETYTPVIYDVGGANQEIVTPTAVDHTGNTMTCIFTKTHLASVSVAAGPPGSIGPVFTDNSAYNGTSIGNGIWACFNTVNGDTNQGAIYYNGVKISGSDFLHPHSMFTQPNRAHIIDFGIQLVGGTDYRVAVLCNGTHLQDITISEPTFGEPIFCAFQTDNLEDANTVYFRSFEYKTTQPNTALKSNPNPSTAPVLNGTPTFTIIESTTEHTTFDEEVTFDLTAVGHAGEMNSWGGQIVLQAKSHSASNYQDFGYLQPTPVGTSYQGTWIGLGLGSAANPQLWDLGIAFIDQTMTVTPTLFLATVNGAGAKVGPGGLIINRSLATPNVTVVGVVNGDVPDPTINPTGGTQNNNSSYFASDVEATIYLNSAPVTPGNSDYLNLAFHYRVHRGSGGPNVWTPSGEVVVPVDGSGNILTGSGNPLEYSYTTLINGTYYDFGVAWSGDSGYGPIVQFQSNFQNKDHFVHGRYMDHGQAVPSPDTSAITIGNTFSDTFMASTIDFTFTVDNQPIDGTLGRVGIWGIQIPSRYDSSWTALPRLYADLEAFGNNSSPIELSGADPKTLNSTDKTFTYNPFVSHIPNGINMVFYATYINNNGRETPIPSFFRYVDFGGVTAGSPTTVNLKGSGHAGLHVGDQVAFLNYNPSDGVKEYSTVISVSGASFTCNLSNNYSNNTVVVIGKAPGTAGIGGFIGALTTQSVVIPGGSQPQMPSGMTYAGGTSVSTYSYTAPVGGAYHTAFTFSPLLTGGTPQPVDGTLPLGDPWAPTLYNNVYYGGWGNEWLILQRVNNSGTVDTTKTNPHKDYSVTGRFINQNWVNGAGFEIITAAMSADNAYQLAAVPVDKYGGYGPIYIFSTLTVAQGFGATPNLIVDSSFLKVKGWVQNPDGSYTAHDTVAKKYGLNIPYWAFGGNLSLTETGSSELVFGIIESRLNMSPDQNATNTHKGSNAIYLTPDGDRGTYYYAYSEPIHLKQGVTYALSGYIDATNCSHSGSANPTGLPYWAIRDTNTTWDPYHGNNSAIVASASQAFGQLGRVTTTYTPISDQTVCVIFNSNGCKVNSNILVGAEPMLQMGAFAGSYHPGPSQKKHKPKHKPKDIDTMVNPINGDADFTNGGPNSDEQDAYYALDFGGGFISRDHHHPDILAGAVTSFNKNLCPDSDFVTANYPTNNTNIAYNWVSDTIGGPSNMGWHLITSGNTFSGGGYCFQIVNNTGVSATTSNQTWSTPIVLKPNTTYELSCFISASNATSGSAAFSVYEWTGSALGTLVGQVTQQNGNVGRVNNTITTPSSPPSNNYVVVFEGNGVGLPNNLGINFSEPMIQIGNVMTSYQPGINNIVPVMKVRLQLSPSNFVPSGVGIDTGSTVVVPYHPLDDQSVVSWKVIDIFFRAETAGTGTTTINIQRSTGTGVFSNVGNIDSSGVSIGSGVYESSRPASISTNTISSGDKVRVNYAAVGPSVSGVSVYLVLEQII